MFEISDLKAKKLPELQEIAKELNVPKFKTLKKLDLVYQILDVQASNPKAVAETVATTTADDKPEPKQKRARTPRPKKTEANDNKGDATEKAPQKREPRNKKDDSKGQSPQQKKDNKPQNNNNNNSQKNQSNRRSNNNSTNVS